ncbi:MAG: mannose-6-phosphate isomerase, class I [Nocardioidaceae bacterium]|nr:mannose-6-phosphate isomerase, class I [Nocardioidaceae bacterium]MCL2613033.1 mannose-6-phosphate isomerase, class I [Nocardioidaceae bacterium]
MFALDCATQGYDWGSTDGIPLFRRSAADGAPLAEVWMGTHPLGPAQIETPDGRRPLSDVAGELPFMMKILSAAQPLSIQVHPQAARARSGYAEEEAAGVPLDAPHRVYKDPSPKPEMVYALSTFDTLVGFRPTAEILRVLSPIENPTIQSLTAYLRRNPGFRGIVNTLRRLLDEPPAVAEIHDVVEQCGRALDLGIDVKRAYATALMIAEHFPDDVGVLISLMLNRLTLQPGEAAYLEAGIIHAHLSGMCLEVMVSSDNVLRAGLTTKHVAPAELVRCLAEGMSRVSRVTPNLFGLSTDIFAPRQGDFALSLTQCSPADPDGLLLPGQGHRLMVCTGGEVIVTNTEGDGLRLQRGDVAYAGPADGDVHVIGTGELAQAYRPTDDDAARIAVLTDLV